MEVCSGTRNMEGLWRIRALELGLVTALPGGTTQLSQLSSSKTAFILLENKADPRLAELYKSEPKTVWKSWGPDHPLVGAK